jgi:hypothetical protein
VRPARHRHVRRRVREDGRAAVQDRRQTEATCRHVLNQEKGEPNPEMLSRYVNRIKKIFKIIQAAVINFIYLLHYVLHSV